VTTAVASGFRRYVVPGLVFKAAVIGGAYSTGRELAAFFAPHGPWGGVLGMAAATLVWSITYAVSLEFARLTRSYDYKTFFQNLIGPWSLIIEVLMIVLMFLIVSVLEATASEMFHALTGSPIWLGCSLFTSIVALVLLLGTRRIETLISYWSFVLYAFYALFLILALRQFGPRVTAAFAAAPSADLLPSIGDGVRYAGYIAAIAMVLFTARNVSSRREAHGQCAPAESLSLGDSDHAARHSGNRTSFIEQAHRTRARVARPALANMGSVCNPGRSNAVQRRRFAALRPGRARGAGIWMDRVRLHCIFHPARSDDRRLAYPARASDARVCDDSGSLTCILSEKTK
jgi:hypothetical protein